MDNNITIALIGVSTAFIASVPGILAYFNQKKSSKFDATQKITDAAVKLVEPLREQITLQQIRIDALEKENVDLTKQMRSLLKKNDYITDLEFTNNKLEEDIAILTGKLETQGRMILALIDAIRCYTNDPDKDRKELDQLLSDMEKQENNVRNS